MKTLIIITFLVLSSELSLSQKNSTESYFNIAAKNYINGDYKAAALQTQEGLKHDSNNKQLLSLKSKILDKSPDLLYVFDKPGEEITSPIEETIKEGEVVKIKSIPTKLTRIPGGNRITWNSELNYNSESFFIRFYDEDNELIDEVNILNIQPSDSYYEYNPGAKGARNKTKVRLEIKMKGEIKLIGKTALQDEKFYCSSN